MQSATRTKYTDSLASDGVLSLYADNFKWQWKIIIGINFYDQTSDSLLFHGTIFAIDILDVTEVTNESNP